MAKTPRDFGRRSGTASRTFALFLIAAVVVALTPIGTNAYVQPPIYRSQGGVTEVVDPQNAANDVIRFTTTGTVSASVTRDLRAKNIQVEDMTNMISVKYFFLNKSCVAGSPRFQLNIDTHGALATTGTTVGNAFGQFGNVAFGGGCVLGQWVTEDKANLTTTGQVWDASQFGGGQALTWAQFVTFMQTTHPNHRVRACGVFDDSGTFTTAAQGTVYLDNTQCHDRVLEDALDVSPGTNDPF